MKISYIKILLLISSIALFSISFANADPVMVKCEGVKNEAGGCKKGCSVQQSSKITTLEECKRQGGNPILIESQDNGN